MNKTILDLNYRQAIKFFLDEKVYCTIDLPEYFSFQNLLNSIHNFNQHFILSSPYWFKPKEHDNVNYVLFHNKDWEYSWRKMELINPVLYIALIHQITKRRRWNELRKRFNFFKKYNLIKCVSIPVVDDKVQKNSKQKQILSWWENIEQKSIELSLDFQYVFHTDIVDCYGSIYTHSIAWALHWKETAKKSKRNDKFLWNLIDDIFQSMNYWQTNWIPQWSLISDFIAELVLGYIDFEFSKLYRNKKEIDWKKDFFILRYRDDYRIFVNNIELWKEILKDLTNILSNFWMRINPDKTSYSYDIINSSIKKDKIYYLLNSYRNNNLQKYLLILKNFADKFPNSGTLLKELSHFYKKIYFQKKFSESIILISIIVNIISKNPRTYPLWVSIIWKILSTIEDKKSIFEKILNKIQSIPNTEHLYIFLQRLALKIDEEKKFQWKLNQKIFDNKIEIWNFAWNTNKDLNKILKNTDIIDWIKINQLDIYPTKDSVLLFKTEY